MDTFEDEPSAVLDTEDNCEQVNADRRFTTHAVPIRSQVQDHFSNYGHKPNLRRTTSISGGANSSTNRIIPNSNMTTADRMSFKTYGTPIKEDKMRKESSEDLQGKNESHFSEDPMDCKSVISQKQDNQSYHHHNTDTDVDLDDLNLYLVGSLPESQKELAILHN
jgi:hypothetical protein